MSIVKIVFILDTCSGIQKQISTSSLVRKLVALTFLRASMRYMECRRIYEVWSSAIFVGLPKSSFSTLKSVFYAFVKTYFTQLFFSKEDKKNRGCKWANLNNEKEYRIIGILLIWCNLDYHYVPTNWNASYPKGIRHALQLPNSIFFPLIQILEWTLQFIREKFRLVT